MTDSKLKTGGAPRAAMRRMAAFAAVALATFITLITTAPARADFGVTSGTFTASLSTGQAGAHPDLTTSFTLNTTTDQFGDAVVDGDMKDVQVDLPPGFVGNPEATPKCPLADLPFGQCDPSSQVGILTVIFWVGGGPQSFDFPLYNLEPGNGHTAEFGAFDFFVPIVLVSSVRSDGGITTRLSDASTLFQLDGSAVTFWGVPADHNGGSAPRRAFLTNPSTCGAAPVVKLGLTSWQHPNTSIVEDAALPAITGCDQLTPPQAAATVTPDSTGAGTPDGYRVDLNVSQDTDPDHLGTPPVKQVSLQLPAGTVISPGAADGLTACSDDPNIPGVGDQLGVGSTAPANCPAASKIGTVTIASPDLGVPLTGALYVGKPRPGDLFRLFLVASGQGVTVKLVGGAQPNPQTGQLTVTFDNAPPLPFSDLTVDLKGGSRAVLANAIACGPQTSSISLLPYGTAAVAASSAFDLSWDGSGAPCPGSLPFAPGMSAGATTPKAGASSPFVFRLTRDDRNQFLGRIADVHLPPGLTANVNGVALCPDSAVAAAAARSGAAEQASPSCPADSRIGSAVTGAGPGSNPLYLSGSVYLTGPYKGAPYGLAIVVPAVAGPFDLGTVVVRAAVRVNNDASLTVESDDLPTILQGIPLQLRDIRLNLDRSGFMLNPTSCTPSAITANVISTTGTVAPVSSRFQVGDCAALPFSPAVRATTSGVRSKSHAARLHVTLMQGRGQAGLRAVRVVLPKVLAARVATLNKACTQQQFDAGSCAKSAQVGGASASTSILPAPLKGPVYIVSGGGHLPKLMIPLSGNGIRITLTGDVTVDSGGRLITEFDNIPDVPISRFDLDLPGGSHSILQSNGSLCRGRLSLPTVLLGQNGKRIRQSTRLHVSRCRRTAAARFRSRL